MVPFHLTKKEDVTTWIQEKNRETSVESAKISYTSNTIYGLFSRIMCQTMPLKTKEGVLWISKNALNYLSVPEQLSELSLSEKLSLHILAENRLKKLDLSAIHPEEELPALNRFLSLFNLTLEQKTEQSVTKLTIRALHDERSSISSSTPEFVIRLLSS